MLISLHDLWEISSQEMWNTAGFVQLLIHYNSGWKTGEPACTVFSLNVFPSSRASHVPIRLSIKHDSYLDSLGKIKASGSITQASFTWENGREDRQRRKRACKFLYSGLSRMLSCGRRTGVHANSQRLCRCVRACAALQQRRRYTHTVPNAAVRAFDVQGAVSVVHVCPLISFPALRVKHGNKGKQHIQKCQTTHLAFHVSWITVIWKQLQSAQTQDRLIDSGCYRRREVSSAQSIHLCHELSSSKSKSNLKS